MPEAEVIVLVDDLTIATLKETRVEIFNYAKIVVKDFPQKYTSKIRSRLLKISSREIVEGKFLYVDVDTIIVNDLQFVFTSNADVAMVLDKHCTVRDNFRSPYIEYNAKKMNYSSGHEGKHFNGGVIYSNDTPIAYEYFKQWKKLYLECVHKQLYIDQTALNEANARNGGIISELPGEWNVQLDSGLKYVCNANIFHYSGYQPFDKNKEYFNFLPFSLCDDDLFKYVKNTGKINDEIEQILDCPQKSFKQSYIIPNDCVAYRVLFTNHFRILKYLYVKHHRWFVFWEKVFGVMFKMIFKRV
jgi:lipopolysaccharide biosynthesis glycosyltransferase